MTVRRTILLLCLTLLPLSAMAQEEGRIYVIKKGDTLWGLSKRFIADPDYWPNLWANNPQVTNPHLIYPGQKVRIYDGRIEFVPVESEVEGELPAPVAEAAEEAVTVRTMGGAEGFISLDELGSAGTLIDTTDNRILMGEGERVFIELSKDTGAVAGDSFTLFEPGREILHPISGEPFGRQVVRLGTLRVLEVGPAVVTAEVVDAFREIQRGARLRPYSPPRLEVALKKSAQALSGYLVSAKGNQIVLGQSDVIYVDLGLEDGLEVGNLLYISRARKATELGLQTDEVPLPDIFLGTAVVLDSREKTATALILKAQDPIYRGDRVLTAD